MTVRRPGRPGQAGPRRAAYRGPLSDEDVRLWEMMKQRLEPLRNPKRRVTSDKDQAEAVARRPTVTSAPLRADAPAVPPPRSKSVPRKSSGRDFSVLNPEAAKPAASKTARPAPHPPAAPQPALIEKRKSRQLAKGRREIDAVLDLHGLRQSEAHAALRHFVARSQANGAKFVKVITGTGARGATEDPRSIPFDAPAQGERGVLKRLVPQWLLEPDLRRLVVGTSSAGRGHGGEGALYIELRRKGPAR